MLNNIVFTCFLGLLVIVLTNCQNQGSTDASGALSRYYYGKCFNQTKNEEAFNKLYTDFSQFSSFLEYTFTLIPEKKEFFCDEERKQLNKRMGQVTTDLSSCLAPEEKYLSEFIETSFMEFTNFLCDNNAENVRSYFSRRNEQCRINLSNDFTPNINNCLGRIFKPRTGVLAKKDLCDDITVAEKCFDSVLNEKCPDNYSYKELSRSFFRYVSKPCSDGCTTQINILLLMLSVVASYLFGKK